MLARTAAALSIAAATAVAGAAMAQEPYSPPHMTWSPPSPAGGAEADPAHATTTAGATSTALGWEWGLGLVAGHRSGGISGRTGLGVGLDGALLVHLGARFAAGAMVSTGPALGLHVLAGPRFRLSPGLRLDLLASAGVSREEVGASEALIAPTLGARAGITWAGTGGGRFLTLGAAAAHAFPGTVTTTWCVGSVCGSDEVDAGGETVVGVFLTFGAAHPGGG